MAGLAPAIFIWPRGDGLLRRNPALNLAEN
jgi:hypothetical protein